MDWVMLSVALLQVVLLGSTIAAAVAARSRSAPPPIDPPAPASPAPPAAAPAPDPGTIERLDTLEAGLGALDRAVSSLGRPAADPHEHTIRTLTAAVAALTERLAVTEARAATLEDRLRLPLLDSPKSAESATAPTAPAEPAAAQPPGRLRKVADLPSSVFDFDPEILLTPPDRGRARAIRTDPPPGEDKLAGARRDPNRNWLTGPAFGAPEDLTQLRGVDADLAAALAGLGVFYLWQVAAWHVQDVAEVARALHLPVARISSDGWVRQARAMVDGGRAAAAPR